MFKIILFKAINSFSMQKMKKTLLTKCGHKNKRNPGSKYQNKAVRRITEQQRKRS